MMHRTQAATRRILGHPVPDRPGSDRPASDRPASDRLAGSSSVARPLRALVAVIGVAALMGCARADRVFNNAAVTARPPVVSTDPVVIFASQAQPGASTRLALADGSTAQVRLVRSYHAASGRECRELRVDAGMAERARLVCAAPEGGWVEARPLLRGGGAGRP